MSLNQHGICYTKRHKMSTKALYCMKHLKDQEWIKIENLLWKLKLSAAKKKQRNQEFGKIYTLNRRRLHTSLG